MSLEFDKIKAEYSQWVLDSLKKEYEVKNAEVEVTGMSEKGDNYMGDVIFLKIKGLEGTDEVLNLVMKKGKNVKMMREEWQSGLLYLRENDVYQRIFPAFKEFQLERNVEELFEAYPKCYGIKNDDESEAILMENLKENGYTLHDRYVNMNMEHIKSVLKNYAKFHATSFAMQDQEFANFEELAGDFSMLFMNFLNQDDVKVFYEKQLIKILEIIEDKDPGLAVKFKEKTQKGLIEVIKDVCKAQPEERVITHGDCWNNNFMFKYEDEHTKEIPSKVAILDWQLSALHSPVIDLSYFLYIVSSNEEISQFDQLLKFYHKNLSDSIREMGSDPEKLFPYSKLLEHWEKYSGYGMTWLVSSLEGMTYDKKDVVTMEEYELDKEAFDNMTAKPKNYELYKTRIFSNVKHYCDGVL